MLNREVMVWSTFADGGREYPMTRFSWSTGWSRWTVTLQRWDLGGARVVVVNDDMPGTPDWELISPAAFLRAAGALGADAKVLAAVIRVLVDGDIRGYVARRRAMDKLVGWPLVDFPRTSLQFAGRTVRAWPTLTTGIGFAVLDDGGHLVRDLPPEDACWLTCRTAMQLNPSGQSLITSPPTGAHVVTGGQAVVDLVNSNVYLHAHGEYLRLRMEYADLAQTDLRPALTKYVAVHELADDLHTYADTQALALAKRLLSSQQWDEVLD